jgi:hypothetical protein
MHYILHSPCGDDYTSLAAEGTYPSTGKSMDESVSAMAPECKQVIGFTSIEASACRSANSGVLASPSCLVKLAIDRCPPVGPAMLRISDRYLINTQKDTRLRSRLFYKDNYFNNQWHRTCYLQRYGKYYYFAKKLLTSTRYV